MIETITKEAYLKKEPATVLCLKCGRPMWLDSLTSGTPAYRCPIDGSMRYPRLKPITDRCNGAQESRGRGKRGADDPKLFERILDMEDRGLFHRDMADHLNISIKSIDRYLKLARDKAWKEFKGKVRTRRMIKAHQKHGMNLIDIADLMEIRLCIINRLAAGE